MRRALCLSIAFALAGCASVPPGVWVRTDGQTMRDNPVLAQQGDLDRTICQGEIQRANLSGVSYAGGGFVGIAAATSRAQAAGQVGTGCMAEKGYVFVPEDQAESRRQEFLRVAELKKQQEAAAAKPEKRTAKKLTAAQ